MTVERLLTLCLWGFGGIVCLMFATFLASLCVTSLIISIPLAVTAVIGLFASLLTSAIAILAGCAAYYIVKMGIRAFQKAQPDNDDSL